MWTGMIGAILVKDTWHKMRLEHQVCITVDYTTMEDDTVTIRMRIPPVRNALRFLIFLILLSNCSFGGTMALLEQALGIFEKLP